MQSQPETSPQFIPLLEKIPYPEQPWLKTAFKLPMVLYRLGLGSLVGRLFMVITTRGRKSGQPRRTAVEFHIWHGRKFVVAAWQKSDWYRNILADPRVTIQTAAGVEHVIARRLTEDADLEDVYAFAEQNPLMRRIWEAMGFKLTREEFIRNKAHIHVLTFDPTGEPTPPPLESDLEYVWIAGLVGFSLGWLAGRRKG